MRILFVTASYLPESVGGVELHVAGLCRAMAAAGHEPAVFARTGRPDLAHLEVARDRVDGIPVTRLANTFEDATDLPTMVAHEGVADRFAAELERLRPDVVHVHHLTCLSTRIPERARAAGVPVVMTLHDFWMGCPRGQRITAGLDLCPEIRLEKCVPCLRELWPHLLGRGRPGGEAQPPAERDATDRALLEDYHGTIRATLAACDRLVTPSAFMKQMFVADGVPAERVAVVENGIRTEAFADVRRAPHEGPLRVGFIGSVIPSKGVHLALEAVRLLGDPGRFELHVHGAVLPFHHDTAYGERLETLRGKTASRVELHGAYAPDDLPELLSRLDVVVVPSLWYEAFGLTIREAFCAGVPVVTANHGAMAEAVDDGVTGLLFDAGDARSLADRLRRLADEPGLRARLAAAAASRVRDEADAARELLGIYAALLTPGAAR